eukprot:2565869-Amphidinium_carterae.2
MQSVLKRMWRSFFEACMPQLCQFCKKVHFGCRLHWHSFSKYRRCPVLATLLAPFRAPYHVLLSSLASVR